MIGKLKNTLLYEHGKSYNRRTNDSGVVEIVEQEEHSTYGTRYRVLGHGDRWFEKNCFEYITGELKPIDRQCGFKTGDKVVALCADWEHANPMTIITFSADGLNKYSPYDIVCIGSDGKRYCECPECFEKIEEVTT